MSKNVDKWSVRPRVRVYLVMCTMCTMAYVLTISKIMADGTTPITMYSKVSSHLYLKKQLAYCTTQPTEPSSLFDTVRIVCTAGSMQLSVCPFFRQSVGPSVPLQQRERSFDTMRAVPCYQPSDVAEDRLVC